MQRKLSEIAEIPKILSSTLETVSQTFDKFLPPNPSQAYESDDLDSVSDDNDEVLSEPDSLEMENIYKDITPESDYVSETNDEDDEDTERMENNEDDYYQDHRYTWNLSNIPEVTIEETEETEEDREPSPEELFRQEKQEKMEKLERAWPWADREKIIYKQSTCHLMQRQPLGIVEDRIKLLARKNITAIFERKQAEN